jgi:hypothetical protein
MLFFGVLFISSCDKGYEIRFSNYSTEIADSVLIGDHKIIYTKIPEMTSSDYQPIKRGHYDISILMRSGKRYYSNTFVSGFGSGKLSLQVDAIGQVSVQAD